MEMAIGTCQRIDWDAYDDLDPVQGDARIVAEVINTRGVSNDQKVVVSQDINPVMAGRHGLRTFHVPERWLPKPDRYTCFSCCRTRRGKGPEVWRVLSKCHDIRVNVGNT